MGIRLYPQNMKEVLIEKFGKEVMEENNKFEEWLEKFPVKEDKKGYWQDKIRDVFDDYEAINHFKLFGYGRFNDDSHEIVCKANLYEIGATNNKTVVDKIAIAMNIKEKVTGFYWE